MSDERQPQPRRRGGSKKGRRFQRVKRDNAADPLLRTTIWLLESDSDFLRKFGKGNMSRGLREMIALVRRMREAP